MGSVFLVMPVPVSTGLKNYKTSLKILSLAYFSLAVLNTYVSFIDQTNQNPDYFNFIDLLISSVQTLLFTFTLITLFNPGFVTRVRLIKNLLAIASIVLIYLLFLILFHDEQLFIIANFGKWITHPTSLIRLLFCVFFLGQLIYFTILFIKQEKIYLRQLDDYFSGTHQLRMKWVRYAFLSAFTIGLISLAIQIFPYKEFNLVFTVAVTLFYFIFAIKYLNYNKLFAIIKPVLAVDPSTDLQQSKMNRGSYAWAIHREAIISEKVYLKEGITLDEIAQNLKIGRTTLSAFINTEEKVNFYLWINQLRIEEAKILIKENPGYSLIRISELSGFSEHSNFSRQFKTITGETPSAWRNRQLMVVE